MKSTLYTPNAVKTSGGILINLEKVMLLKRTYVSSEDWICNYQKLLYDSQKPHTIFDFSNEDLDFENENLPNNDILGQLITTNEIHEQISKLKLKKKLRVRIVSLMK